MYLYVMGRGHSGSTILDILLGNASTVESVGELVPGMANPQEPCSCGASLVDCTFWRGVRSAVKAAGIDYEALVRTSRAQANIGHLPAVAFARPGSNHGLDRLANDTAGLADAICAMSGKKHLLDSGKEPTRALFLLKFLPGTCVIHLVRDPRAVLSSNYRRIAGGEGLLFLRRRYRARRLIFFWLLLVAANWTGGNLIAQTIAWLHPGRVLRLRYEDLRDNTAETIAWLGAGLGLPLEDVVEKLTVGEGFAVRHNLGGNRIRHEGVMWFDPQKDKKPPPAPGWVAATAVALCWPFMVKYGYRIRQSKNRLGLPDARH